MAVPSKILLLGDNPVKDYLGRIQSGVAREASRSAFSQALENVHDTGKALKDILADDSLAGIILTPPFSDDRHALLAIEARRIPYVRIAPLLDPDRGSSVMMDEYEAARAITDHLLARGHRRIAILRGPKSHLVSMRRYNGYAAALGSKGVRVDQSLVATGDFSRESGRAEAAKLFAMNPDAIFSSNDDMAAGIIDAAASARVDIPGTISLVGYDDNALAKSVRPRLTTVRQPLEEMGAKACELLLARIKNPTIRNETAVVPFEIIERESVRDLRSVQAA